MPSKSIHSVKKKYLLNFCCFTKFLLVFEKALKAPKFILGWIHYQEQCFFSVNFSQTSNWIIKFIHVVCLQIHNEYMYIFIKRAFKNYCTMRFGFQTEHEKFTCENWVNGFSLFCVKDTIWSRFDFPNDSFWIINFFRLTYIS